MERRTWWLAGVLAAMAALFPHGTLAGENTLRMQVMGEIAIDQAGAVYDYNISTILTPEVKQLVERTVRLWTFEPVLRDGKPVYARSSMHLTLLATPVEAGYRMQVEDVRFLGSRPMKTPVAPRYPRDAVRAGINAIVLVAARIDADGKVLDAAAARSALIGVRANEKVAEKWRRRFEESCVAAMKQWTFQAADLAAGDPPETTVIIPMVFQSDVEDGPIDRVWRANDLAGPPHPIPWLAPAMQTFDAEGLREGQMIALDNPIRLRSKVEGTVL